MENTVILARACAPLPEYRFVPVGAIEIEEPIKYRSID